MDAGETRTLPRLSPRTVALRPITARLVVVHPPAGTPVEVAAAPLVLGRRTEAGVVGLEQGTVSRRHFAIEWDAPSGHHIGRDLGSRNGSLVDGAPAGAACRLAEGSVVRLGDVHLVYERIDDPGEADSEVVSREAVPGDARCMAALRVQIARAARDGAPVLLHGETGTGKERIAAELHRLSGRRGPFLAVNCGALTRDLVESQLFGHVRGAFTGATEAQPGWFRSADGGTLLLDEIGELPAELQPRLLRVLQEGEVQPVGSARAVRVDVRVVAATHRDLAEAAESGSFRRDLYARLSLWEIAVPALRRRRVDLFGWIERLGGPAASAFEPDAAARLLGASWPTNLRGLDRLGRELSSSRRPIGEADLPSWIDRPGRAIDARSTDGPGPSTPRGSTRPGIPSAEEFATAFEQCGGSARALARHFGRDRRQIHRWLTKYGLRPRS